MKKRSDSVIHLPSGSSVPGKIDPNPYVNYVPRDLRKLLLTETDEAKLEQIESALKQWERIYQDMVGYPWRRVAGQLSVLACKMAELNPSPQNLNFYYHDVEVPDGFDEILESLQGLYDQENQVRFDIPRQGERPERDISVAPDITQGDFSTPLEGPLKDVKPRGAGPDPEGMDNPLPPTGGDIEGWPEMI